MFSPAKNPAGTVAVSFIDKELLVSSLAAKKKTVQINCYFNN